MRRFESFVASSAPLVLMAAWSAACSVPDSRGPFPWSELASLDGSVPTLHQPIPDAGTGPTVAAPDASLSASDADVDDDAAAPMLDVFAAAPTFASAPVAESAVMHMAATGVVPTKRACLSCHDGRGAAPAWLAAGTVFSDLAGSQGAADLEIRVVDTSTSQVYSAHSDADGNFWIPAPASAASGPFMIGIRTGTSERTMPLVQRALDCNGSACHGGAQGPIHLP